MKTRTLLRVFLCFHKTYSNTPKRYYWDISLCKIVRHLARLAKDFLISSCLYLVFIPIRIGDCPLRRRWQVSWRSVGMQEWCSLSNSQNEARKLARPSRRASLKCPNSLLCHLDVEPLYLR